MYFILLAFVLAAVLEVGGDATIRAGLRHGQPWIIVAGCLILSAYGALVNCVKWDFSKLIGAYVSIFALFGVLAGKVLFSEVVPFSTWLGLVLIIIGGLIIQSGVP